MDNKSKDVFSDDEINLIDLFHVLWGKKIIIILTTLIFAGIGFFGIIDRLMTPSTAIMTQKFSLKFLGIEENIYPNGLSFSMTHLTSPQVLEAVYNKNKLADYGLNMHNLRDNLIINKSVDGLIALEGKYKTLLEQKGLSPEQLQILQDEYQDQRLKLFKSPYYKISFIDGSSRLSTVVQEKVLLDILSQWAFESEAHKGVYLYQVPIVTADAFYFENVDEEYIVKVDMLRHVVENVKDNLGEIKKLPGALLAETSSGSKLTALQIRTNDLLNYQIGPLTGLIRSGGLHVNRELSLIYTQEQLYNLALKKGVLQGEMSLLSDALDGYINSNDRLMGRAQSGESRRTQDSMSRSTVIPQIGDRFLDQLVALANDNQDVAYRQDLTTRMVAVGHKLLLVEKDISYYQALLQARKSEIKKGATLLDEFKKKNTLAVQEAKLITAEMTELYKIISQKYLQVSDTLYQLEGPIQNKVDRGFSLKKLLLIYSLSIAVFFCVICFSILLFTALVKNKDVS